MPFITRGGEGLEDKNEDRKATRSEGMGLKGALGFRSGPSRRMGYGAV